MGKNLKISIWKKVFSYFKDVHIESRSSKFNSEIQLLLVKGRFQLCCGSAIYSFDDLYDNFGFSFDQLNLNKLNIEEVLILGMGLASIPYILERLQDQYYNYTAIEIDEEIISLANDYALPRLQSSMNIICGDAERFVFITEQKFDLITMDVFEEQNVPQQMKKAEFIGRLKELLNPTGVVLMNMMAADKESKEKSQSFFDNVFLNVFPDATILKIKGNYMMLSDKTTLKH